MHNECYSPGTIKVAWIDGKDFHVMKSEFFISLKEAKTFCKLLYKRNLHYMVMRLERVRDDSYQWRILPLGPTYKQYNRAMTWRKQTWLGKFLSA